MRVWNMAWPSVKCKPSSNVRQDFPYHYMNLCSETWKKCQSKFSASTSIAETLGKSQMSLGLDFYQLLDYL